ncbi:MAG: superfamily II DNA helicase RecQ [Nitrospinales bacterium]|jgi:superfamily II DNA helicase RecQ
MQIKIFNIPIPFGEQLTEEMNTFLRSKRVLQTESHFISNHQGSFWCFCIKYEEHTGAGNAARKRIDYKEVLDELSFQRFARMREIRKQLATEEGIPAYAIFTDAELAGLAKPEQLTLADMLLVKGVGEKKVEKYGAHFIK